VSLHETIVGSARTPLVLLLASVGVVLLIACVNVGNLLMARAVDRQKEIAVRAALGANRLAVMRQLLVEASLLAFAAAAAGLALAGLLVQTMLRIQRTNLGFDPHNVFTLQFRLPATKYRTPEEIARFLEAAHERVSNVPGVTAAALVRRVPLSGNRGNIAYAVEGRPAAADLSAGENFISPGYFRTMRIPLVRGRDFTERDDLAAPGVLIVNQTLARVVFGEDDAIGKRLTFPGLKTTATVVGVVGDAKHLSPTELPQPQI